LPSSAAGSFRVAATPPLREAADLQTRLWLGDGYEAQLDAAEPSMHGELEDCADGDEEDARTNAHTQPPV